MHSVLGLTLSKSIAFMAWSMPSTTFIRLLVTCLMVTAVWTLLTTESVWLPNFRRFNL
jgi:hypothetical protein